MCLMLQVQPVTPEEPKGWEQVLLSLLKGWGQELQPDLLGPEIFNNGERIIFLTQSIGYLERVGPSHGIEDGFLDVPVHPLQDRLQSKLRGEHRVFSSEEQKICILEKIIIPGHQAWTQGFASGDPLS